MKYTNPKKIARLKSVTRTGDITELEVCLAFIEAGYEVFRNVVSDGPADIVVLNPKTGTVFLHDTKTTSTSTADKPYYKPPTEAQEKLGITTIGWDRSKKKLVVRSIDEISDKAFKRKQDVLPKQEQDS